MARVDPERAVGALIGLASGGDAEAALRLGASLIEAGGYDPGSRRGGLSGPADATPLGIAFAGREEALRDATIAEAGLSEFDPLEGKIALLHNQAIAWCLTGGPELVSQQLKEPEWLDDRIEDVVIPATAGVLSYATSLARSEPDSALAAIAVGLAAFFNSEGFDAGLAWATGLVGPNAGAAGALLGARFGAPVEGREDVESIARRLAAMAG